MFFNALKSKWGSKREVPLGTSSSLLSPALYCKVIYICFIRGFYWSKKKRRELNELKRGGYSVNDVSFTDISVAYPQRT